MSKVMSARGLGVDMGLLKAGKVPDASADIGSTSPSPQGISGSVGTQIMGTSTKQVIDPSSYGKDEKQDSTRKTPDRRERKESRKQQEQKSSRTTRKSAGDDEETLEQLLDGVDTE